MNRKKLVEEINKNIKFTDDVDNLSHTQLCDILETCRNMLKKGDDKK